MRTFAIISVSLVVLIALVYAFSVFRQPTLPQNQRGAEENSVTTSMILTSPSFNSNESIPQKFTCEGGNINPELHIQHVPENAKSLVLIMDDPDAPHGTFTHWLVWNIDPSVSIVKEDSVPSGALEGINEAKKVGYTGPCPPPGKPHRYFFKLYSLDTALALTQGAKKSDLEAALQGHVIAKAELAGLYQR